MIDLLTKKVASGDLFINLAAQYLGQNEWGLARRAVEEGFSKGHLSDPDVAHALQRDIYQRLGIQSEV